MPAPAVIPAPIVYIKVVAVKKLVVEFLIFSFYALDSLRRGQGIRKNKDFLRFSSKITFVILQIILS